MFNAIDPFLSIVIPTRERSATLKFTLKTALDQTDDDYEIVVSDNFSQDETERVVLEFQDPRIKYVNTGRRLSMSDNYEFAAKNVRGKYVIYIGDDDAIMPDAVSGLKRVSALHPSQVYFWEPHLYRWPIGTVGGRVDHIAPVKDPSPMNLTDLAKFSIRCGTWRYYALPCLYHSAVSKAVLDKIRSRTGRVFHSTNPDVFMAFALPAVCASAVNVGLSLTVNGTSGKSNGGSYVTPDGANVLEKFLREYGDYRVHSSLYPGVSLKMNMIPDSALVAMDLFPDFYKDVRFNYSAMWAFMQRLPSKDNGFSVIRHWSDIRKSHDLSLVDYAAFSAIHRIMAFRRRMLKKRLWNRTGAAPSDIAAALRIFREGSAVS